MGFTEFNYRNIKNYLQLIKFVLLCECMRRRPYRHNALTWLVCSLRSECPRLFIFSNIYQSKLESFEPRPTISFFASLDLDCNMHSQKWLRFNEICAEPLYSWSWHTFKLRHFLQFLTALPLSSWNCCFSLVLFAHLLFIIREMKKKQQWSNEFDWIQCTSTRSVAWHIVFLPNTEPEHISPEIVQCYMGSSGAFDAQFSHSQT